MYLSVSHCFTVHILPLVWTSVSLEPGLCLTYVSMPSTGASQFIEKHTQNILDKLVSQGKYETVEAKESRYICNPVSIPSLGPVS